MPRKINAERLVKTQEQNFEASYEGLLAEVERTGFQTTRQGSAAFNVAINGSDIDIGVVAPFQGDANSWDLQMQSLALTLTRLLPEWRLTNIGTRAIKFLVRGREVDIVPYTTSTYHQIVYPQKGNDGGRFFVVGFDSTILDAFNTRDKAWKGDLRKGIKLLKIVCSRSPNFSLLKSYYFVVSASKLPVGNDNPRGATRAALAILDFLAANSGSQGFQNIGLYDLAQSLGSFSNFRELDSQLRLLQIFIISNFSDTE